MTRPTRPILVPEDVPNVRAGFYLERAAAAAAIHTARRSGKGSADELADNLYGDSVTGVLLRGASTPASRTDPTWAGALAVASVGDFVSSLAPLSAGARLINAAVHVSLAGTNKVMMPGRSAPPTPDQVPWVGEGGMIPVLRFMAGGVELGPSCKLAGIAAASRELVESGSGEAIIRQLLRENTALSLDAALFSDAAVDADRPAGILHSIPSLVAAVAGDGAMLVDLGALAGAIGTVTSGLVYIAHPTQASAIKLQRGTTFGVDVWPTLGVAAGTVIALDPAAFASGFDPTPQITSSIETMLLTDDQPGADPMAGPTTSLFQCDLVATKILLRCAWAWRVPGAVAWMQGTNW